MNSTSKTISKYHKNLTNCRIRKKNIGRRRGLGLGLGSRRGGGLGRRKGLGLGLGMGRRACIGL